VDLQVASFREPLTDAAKLQLLNRGLRAQDDNVETDQCWDCHLPAWNYCSDPSLSLRIGSWAQFQAGLIPAIHDWGSNVREPNKQFPLGAGVDDNGPVLTYYCHFKDATENQGGTEPKLILSAGVRFFTKRWRSIGVNERYMGGAKLSEESFGFDRSIMLSCRDYSFSLGSNQFITTKGGDHKELLPHVVFYRALQIWSRGNVRPQIQGTTPLDELVIDAFLRPPRRQ